VFASLIVRTLMIGYLGGCSVPAETIARSLDAIELTGSF
jgi:hypothetical protein